MSEIPAPTLASEWTGIIGGNPVTVQAVDATHGYVSGTSDFLDDIAGGSFLGTAQVLTETVTGGDLTATPGDVGVVNVSEFVAALVIYADTGVAGTSPILAFIDKNSDGTTMNKEGDGGTMNVSFPSDLIARI